MSSWRFAFVVSATLFLAIFPCIQVKSLLLCSSFFLSLDLLENQSGSNHLVGVGKSYFVQKSHAANEVHEGTFKLSSPFSTALETLQKQIGYALFVSDSRFFHF